MQTINAGIVGASGYSGELLVSLLARHPGVASLKVASRSYVGKRVDAVLPALRGRLNTVFIESDPKALAADDEVDVWFLALPHGIAAEFALPLAEAGKVVIDLSADFRLKDPAVYREYYGAEHPAADWLAKVPYVIPELAGNRWKDAQLIASPGCYPTSVLVPLVPLLQKDLLDTERIVINAMSGVSGAGKKATEYYSYCERDSSAVAYGIGKHRHLAEIEEQLGLAAGADVIVQFTPHLVPMSRGIATTIVAPLKGDIAQLYATWESIYAKSPFVHLLPQGTGAETRHVVGTNRVDISATYDARTGNVIISSAIDNLMKGAGGQAIQIFNLRFGFPETAGLFG